ncbi:MAG: AAA family ATPase [Chloroflexi bacterium]|nr:AAA family ATPase [Chloroflexota bacterium]
MNSTASASCSMLPLSRRSLSMGMWGVRCSGARESCEQAMTAIALLFSLFKAKPSPFCVLDEVDAALDEANSQRFAKILNELAHKTQFIVITHNRATMHQADILYGVTISDDGISKLIGLKL